MMQALRALSFLALGAVCGCSYVYALEPVDFDAGADAGVAELSGSGADGDAGVPAADADAGVAPSDDARAQ